MAAGVSDGSIYMDAGDGRRPFAQVLRNSLSGHPPSTGHETSSPDLSGSRHSRVTRRHVSRKNFRLKNP